MENDKLWHNLEQNYLGNTQVSKAIPEPYFFRWKDGQAIYKQNNPLNRNNRYCVTISNHRVHRIEKMFMKNCNLVINAWEATWTRQLFERKQFAMV